MSGGGGGRKRRVEVEHMLLLMSLSTTRDAWLLLSAPAALSTCTRVREVKEWGEGGLRFTAGARQVYETKCRLYRQPRRGRRSLAEVQERQ